MPYPERLHCPTGKVCIPTRQQATFLMRQKRSEGVALRAIYRCPLCGTFHLTHVRPKHRRRRRRGTDDDQ